PAGDGDFHHAAAGRSFDGLGRRRFLGGQQLFLHLLGLLEQGPEIGHVGRVGHSCSYDSSTTSAPSNASMTLSTAERTPADGPSRRSVRSTSSSGSAAGGAATEGDAAGGGVPGSPSSTTRSSGTAWPKCDASAASASARTSSARDRWMSLSRP